MSVGPLDTIYWDEVNEEHVALHDLTPEEVDEVLRDKRALQGFSKSSGRPVVFGWTSTGRYIKVTYEILNDDPRMVYPVTAYEVPPPK